MSKEGLYVPYTALFDNQGRQLIYIAANHTIDPKSTTVQWIKSEFKKYQPDFVIIEGVEEIGGESPKKLINYIENRAIPTATCNESLYAAHLAIKNNIKFIGAEPSNEAIYHDLATQGYTKKDCLFLCFLQQIPHYYREGRFKSENDLPKIWSLWLQEWKATELTDVDFKSWYQQKMKCKISYKALIDPDHCAPIANGTYVQQLSSKVSVMRDRHIIAVILKSLAKYRKVLIIYGHSHFPTQKDVLCHHLGKPKFRM